MSYQQPSTNPPYPQAAPYAPPYVQPVYPQYDQTQLGVLLYPSAQPAYSPYPSVQPVYPPPKSKEELFQEFASKFEIRNNFDQELHTLKKFKIVFLYDDSGSMTEPAYTPEFATPGKNIPSRFQETAEMARDILDGCCILSNDPVDIYFMNGIDGNGIRVKEVSNFNQIQYLFNRSPKGITPTVASLEKIIGDNQDILNGERNLLVFIATDGAPTIGLGTKIVDDTQRFTAYVHQLMRQYPNLYITFMACVSDEKLLGTMDSLGQQLTRVGVIDEYNVECKEMNDRFGKNWFNKNLYITKALLVSICPAVKKAFDDTPPKSCCTIL